MSDNVEDTIGDNDQENLQTVLEDSQKPLYASCTKFIVLSGVLKLFGVKAKHRWTDASFTELLEVVHEMLPDDAKLLRWHFDERKKDGKLRHVADSPQWRKINNKHDEFGGEIRNIRFGLSSNGINPFGNMSSKHSPKRPGNDIDVYLDPLIDDLKTLWNKGVKVYDAYKKENFTLRAMIFCTISDFPAYENLPGYSTKGLLLNIPGKTKDGVNARKDMVEMGIRLQLAPEEKGQRGTYLPPAYYTMSKAEKTQFCECLYGIKVPLSYSSNIKKLVSVQDCKLIGMKSHDCHVFMTQMIPIAIRELLPNNVRHTITKHCLFFNIIHSKVIDPEVLDSWQRDIIQMLCELEMYFPPSFFDIMVHLVSHIITEMKACGPVYLRYMYPFERYMGILKGYIRNRARPEGSIVTGYLAEELIEFSNDVVKGFGNIGIPHSRHKGVVTIGLRMIDPDRDALKVAHSVVLQHMTCITPYIKQHKRMLRATHRGRTNKW
nr:hypothetical protein [Tanacetum cinerariifolium]